MRTTKAKISLCVCTVWSNLIVSSIFYSMHWFWSGSYRFVDILQYALILQSDLGLIVLSMFYSMHWFYSLILVLSFYRYSTVCIDSTVWSGPYRFVDILEYRRNDKIRIRLRMQRLIWAGNECPDSFCEFASWSWPSISAYSVRICASCICLFCHFTCQWLFVCSELDLVKINHVTFLNYMYFVVCLIQRPLVLCRQIKSRKCQQFWLKKTGLSLALAENCQLYKSVLT